jgi:predicted CXXCH cytochrome family protein
MKTYLSRFLSPGAARRTRSVAIGLCAFGIAAFIISCETVNRTVLIPPSIPGAKYVGSDACAACHEGHVRDFKTATHSRLMAKGKNAEGAGCESCHGPGSLHVDAGGGHNTVSKHNIINPRKSPDVCFQCHLDKRGEFNLPYSHPVLKGKVTCIDCHEPHKGDVVSGGGGVARKEPNDICFRCHTAQRGPFIFEHEALREGCVACHKPHGSVNQKMLTERNNNLCLKCHFQSQKIQTGSNTAAGALVIGGRNHSGNLRGTCFSADCHEMVHGSNVNSSLRR